MTSQRDEVFADFDPIFKATEGLLMLLKELTYLETKFDRLY